MELTYIISYSPIRLKNLYRIRVIRENLDKVVYVFLEEDGSRGIWDNETLMPIRYYVIAGRSTEDYKGDHTSAAIANHFIDQLIEGVWFEDHSSCGMGQIKCIKMENIRNYSGIPNRIFYDECMTQEAALAMMSEDVLNE